MNRLSLRRRLTQGFCALWRGHAFLLVIEPQRICVECRLCGLTSPGWDVDFRSPASKVVRFERRRA